MSASISIRSAQRLSTTHNTQPHIPSKSPRWLLKLLPWVHVDTGIYRVNRVSCQLDASGYITVSRDERGNPIVTIENLKQFYLFKNIDSALLDVIAKQLVHKETEAGEVIVKEGEAGDKFYIILNGNFEVIHKGLHGQYMVIANLKEGEYFGEISLLQNIPRQATVISKVPGLLYYLTKSTFDEIIKDPEIRQSIERSSLQRKQELLHVTTFGEKKIPIKAGHSGEPKLPHTFIDYDAYSQEIHLSVIQTIIGIHTRIADIYNIPHNQIEEQIRITTEMILEYQEWELINNKDFGLLHSIAPRETIATRRGPPTPDDLDSLLAIVWKEPSFFLANPKAIAAFGRECTKCGVPPPTLDLEGGTFVTWRGVPIIPTNKLEVESNPFNPRYGTTDIILVRTGEDRQGVVGLYKNDIPNQKSPGLSVHFMGIDDHSIAQYLLTKYFSLAILVPDAVSVLRDVEVGIFYD